MTKGMLAVCTLLTVLGVIGGGISEVTTAAEIKLTYNNYWLFAIVCG